MAVAQELPLGVGGSSGIGNKLCFLQESPGLNPKIISGLAGESLRVCVCVLGHIGVAASLLCCLSFSAQNITQPVCGKPLSE